MTDRDLFIAALNLDDLAERQAYLQDACGDDSAARQRVEALFKVYENAGSFLESPPASPTSSMTSSSPTESSGAVIGPYKLLQPIGEGGMGTVYMAEQTQPVRRTVALKLIKAGMDSRQVLARFGAERQALALMDHPNIAMVFDAGTTDTGRPYFVMELVKGIPITKFCDERKLTLRERLELAIPVCQAVQHAHQKGIIHRDIKPSNVLIALYDGKPVPKVIDFGVAKATGPRLTDQTLYTEFGAIVGTLEYMSPEQAELNQLDIDTRSDIYSLGVLLYELLTGSTPLERRQLKEVLFLEILRVIREEESPRPSLRLSTTEELPSIAACRNIEPRKLSGLMAGELDWIVMKALEKDRERRYETANALASDVRRYLADEPVQACPPSSWYRVAKFARRNKGPVLASAAVLLVLIGGIIGTTWGLVRADRARQSEAQQRRRAQGNEQKALVAAASEKEAKEIALARGAETRAVLEFVENKIFAAARPKGEDGGLGHDATLRSAVESALPFVEKSFTNQPLIEARLRMTLGISFWYLGDAQLAAEQYQVARTIFTKHRGIDHPDTLSSMSNLAVAYIALGRQADALRIGEETLAVRKAKLGPDHPSTLASMNNLANSYEELGRYADALKLHQETLERRKVKLGPNHPDTLTSMNNLANTYGELGRYAEGLKLHEETLALRRVHIGANHPDTLFSMSNVAASYTRLGRNAEALELCRETLALRKVELGPDHPDTVDSMNNLANCYNALGRNAEALALHQETLALRRAKFGPDHPDTLSSMSAVAVSLAKLDRGAEAVPIIDECVGRSAGKVIHPRLIPEVMDLRLRYFAKIQDPGGCRATAEMWEKLKRTDAGSLYDAACMRAVTSAVFRAGDPSEATAKAATAEADRAMAWLEQAIAAGYSDAAHLAQDKDLDSLRDRQDFKKRIAELQARHGKEKKD